MNDKQRKASGVSFGIFLMGLAVLLYTGWWWPGIMVVIGLSSAAELLFRERIGAAVGAMAFFWGIALLAVVVQAIEVPWNVVAPLILVGIGAMIVVKTLFLREESSEEGVG